MARDNGTGSGLMNDCLHYQEKLHDWVDQELDAPTSEEIDLHLSHCPQCADAAKGIQHMKQLIRSKAWKPQTPENLRVGVQEMLTVESTRMQTRSRWSGRTILPLAATAALILIFLTPDIFNPAAFNSSLDASVISEPVFDSHLRSLSGDDQPEALFNSHEVASLYITEMLDRPIQVPEFKNFEIWGVSALSVKGHEIPKIFYRGADSHLSLFLVCMKLEASSGIHTLKNGVGFTVYCFPGADFCCVMATSDCPQLQNYQMVIGDCFCQVKNCSSGCGCHK